MTRDGIAAYLHAARAQYLIDGDWHALPTQAQVAEYTGLGQRTLSGDAAWIEYWTWKKSLPLPACRVCGEPAKMRAQELCHTHRERWRRWGSPEPWQDWADACRENRLNTCQRCGAKFNGAQGRIKLCGDCDLQRRRDRALARYRGLSDEERREAVERAKARSRAKYAARRVPIVCPICGETFVGDPHRVYCDDSCRQESMNRQRREIRRRIKLLQLLQEQTELQRRLTGDD